MDVEDIRDSSKIMNLNYYFSSRHIRKYPSAEYFVVLGYLTDFLPFYDMVSYDIGKPVI